MADRFQLPNGLTVVHEPVRTAPVVAAQVWVKVGSADERPDEVGLAHLHEHMLFKGTARRGPGEVARSIEANGGEVNAWTSYDQTVYHFVMASRFAREGLDVLADAVRNSAFDAGELAREIEVVCEEIKRSQDMPSRRASKALFQAAYRLHPYGRPVIGFEADVRAHTRERVLGFFHRHYAPSNMVLAVAGDLDLERLKELAHELFGGDWGRPARTAVARPVEPPRSGLSCAFAEEDVTEAWLHLAWPGPGVDHPDTPALDLLALLLGQGDASRLACEVKRHRALAASAGAWAYTPQDPGLFAISLVAQKETAQDALEQSLRVLEDLRQRPVDASELVAVKALVEAEVVYQRETVQGLARKLGYYQAALGGIEREARYYEDVAKVTPEQLQDVARRWLPPTPAVATGLLPRGLTLAAADVEGAAARAAGSPLVPATRRNADPGSAPALVRAATARGTAGAVVDTRLRCGARVLVRPESAVPLFALRAFFHGGLRYETQATNGLTAVLARTWTRGTATLSADEVTRRADAMAGSISAGAGRSTLSLRGDFLSRHFDPALALFGEVLRRPAFPDGELERERKFQLQDITARADKPASVAFDLFARTHWRTHPYRLSTVGSAEAVAALERGALADYHRAWLDPAQAVLSVVGDVDPDRVLETCERLFEDAGSAVRPAPTVPAEEHTGGPREARVATQKAQTHLVLGFPGARVTDGWRRALEVLTTLLSGQSGRLFLELRDKQSLCYSVSAMSVEGHDPGYFAVYMATSPQKVEQALAGIRSELRRLVDEKVDPGELDRAREHLVGTHEVALQRNGARAGIMGLDACYGLPHDGYLRYAQEVQAVTAEDVLAVARRVVDFERSTLAVVGPT